MKINLYVIDKKSQKALYDPLIEHLISNSRPWANVQLHTLYPKAVAKAHDLSPQAAQKSYTDTYNHYLKRGYSIALDPQGTMVDSHRFAALLKDRSIVNLFIGGAFGFERGFLDQCNTAISLGKITLSHKLVTVVVLEQIFRGLSILHNHPYHK
jgi:23S rRNA (pseudouridine1915-N3)-methyltransferase